MLFKLSADKTKKRVKTFFILETFKATFSYINVFTNTIFKKRALYSSTQIMKKNVLRLHNSLTLLFIFAIQKQDNIFFVI